MQGQQHDDKVSAVSKKQKREYRQVRTFSMPLIPLFAPARHVGLTRRVDVHTVHEPQGRVQQVRLLSTVSLVADPLLTLLEHARRPLDKIR